MKLALTVLAALLLACPSSHAGEVDSTFVAARATLERGVYAKSPAEMIEGRAVLERLSEKQPKSAILHYWVAYADWRIAARLLEQKPQAQKYVKDGLEHAEKAVKLAPKLAEAVALRASLLGLGIQLEPSNMMAAGLEIEMTMGRALGMAPDNPRVLLLDAMGTLHKPTFVGGGPDRALEKFVRAQARFEAERKQRGDLPAGLEPDWGRFEAYAWAGRSAARLGDRAAARKHYEKALEIEPRNGWVRHVLIPELERADSTATAARKGGS